MTAESERAMCTMLAGRCEDGKTLARKALADTMLRQLGPEQIDKTIDAYVGLYCTGGMGDRDRMLHALSIGRSHRGEGAERSIPS